MSDNSIFEEVDEARLKRDLELRIELIRDKLPTAQETVLGRQLPVSDWSRRVLEWEFLALSLEELRGSKNATVRVTRMSDEVRQFLKKNGYSIEEEDFTYIISVPPGTPAAKLLACDNN